MKMKKYSLIIMLVMVLMACDEQLDLQPISTIGENGFFEDADDVEAALVGAVDGLQITMQREILILENRSDNGKVGAGSGGDYLAIETFDDQAVSSVLTTYWGEMYNAISRVNLVLDNVEVVSDEDRKNEIAGEARFLRAYFYFKLVRMFGEIPLVLESVAPEDQTFLARQTVDAVYAAIKQDLEFSATHLPAASDEKKPSALVAKGLLAKVHLTLGEFAQARPLLNDVIASNAYQLEDNYAYVFDLGNELNDEILYAVQYKSGANGEGNGFSYELSAQSPIGAVRPTEDMVAHYETGDARLDATLDLGSYLVLKYVNDNTSYDGENDWPILRYADILLMYGEVVNELDGPTQQALDYLNATRYRAGLDSLTTVDVDSKESYRAAMETERRIELAFENHRWFDLIRTGRALEVMQAHGAQEGFQVQSFRLLFPIPQREIDTSGEIITQNPGY